MIVKTGANMRKLFLATAIIAITMTSIIGCGKTQTTNNEYYDKAMSILDEFAEDQRIKDFRNAYDILSTLPSSADKFIDQLEKVDEIYKKYDVELQSGDYFLTGKPNISKENIEEYKTIRAYLDSSELMEATVYPTLFEKYGDSAQAIDGSTYKNVVSAIMETNRYSLDKKTENYEGTKEEWAHHDLPSQKYEIKYHRNGKVENLTIPIAINYNPLNDSELLKFFDLPLEDQKEYATSLFMNIKSQIKTSPSGQEVLSQIFTSEEIKILHNYILAMTEDDIWNNNMYASSGEPANYSSSSLFVHYKGYDINITFGLNGISLFISGKNAINELSSKWTTVWAALCYPNDTDTVEKYSDYINNNTAENDVIPEFAYNLDANAEKFSAPMFTPSPTVEDAVQTDNDVQQSIPVEMSMADEITVFGVIEENTTEFPSYRLRLQSKLSFIFDEYLGEKIFECEYLYFYDDSQLNRDFPVGDFIGMNCEITTQLEDYRGGDELFMLYPQISFN